MTALPTPTETALQIARQSLPNRQFLPPHPQPPPPPNPPSTANISPIPPLARRLL